MGSPRVHRAFIFESSWDQFGLLDVCMWGIFWGVRGRLQFSLVTLLGSPWTHRALIVEASLTDLGLLGLSFLSPPGFTLGSLNFHF